MPNPNDGAHDPHRVANPDDPDSTVVVPRTPARSDDVTAPAGRAETPQSVSSAAPHGDDSDETEAVSRNQLGTAGSGHGSNRGGPSVNPPHPGPTQTQNPQPWQSAPPQSGPPYPGTPTATPSGPMPPQQPAPPPGGGFPPAPPAGYGPAGHGYPPGGHGVPPHAGYGPPPGYGNPVGTNAQAASLNMPPPPRDYRADARNALNRGNSWLGRLIRKGVNGELIPITVFQSYRMHKPVPLTVAVFVAGLILAGLFNQSGGLIGLVLSEAMWALTAFVLIAIGTKGALQTVVYGICLVGALGFAAAAYMAFTTYSTLSSLPYSGAASGISISLVVIGVLAVVLAVVHGYIGIQVNREIKKIASGQ